MDALLFAVNLEVLLLQMKILERSAERRFPVDEFKNKRKKQIRDKLVRDRKILKEVALRSLIELVEGGEQYTLKQAVDMLENAAYSEIALRGKYEKLKMSFKNVILELKRNRERWTLDLRNNDIKIAFLRDSIKDNVLNRRCQFSYVDKWLCARAETLELQMQPKPTAVPQSNNENCVHNELVRAYELQIKEREDMLEYWKKRYVTDTKDIEARLADKCEKLRVTVARRAELQALYKLHEGEMRAWLTFKKERAARLAREERLRQTATRIQAWWRGVMVRRALGAFRYLRNAKKTAPKTKKK